MTTIACSDFLFAWRYLIQSAHVSAVSLMGIIPRRAMLCSTRHCPTLRASPRSLFVRWHRTVVKGRNVAIAGYGRMRVRPLAYVSIIINSKLPYTYPYGISNIMYEAGGENVSSINRTPNRCLATYFTSNEVLRLFKKLATNIVTIIPSR